MDAVLPANPGVDRSLLDPDMFGEQLRAFSPENPPCPSPRDRAELLTFQRAWQATLYEAGFIAPGWPRRWGGMGLPLILQAVYHREVALARVPVPPTNFVGIVGPTILLHGTDAQRR